MYVLHHEYDRGEPSVNFNACEILSPAATRFKVTIVALL